MAGCSITIITMLQEAAAAALVQAGGALVVG
jgi:hypothetical protein